MIARVALALVAAVALFPAAARADTYVVNTTADGAGACTAVACTLRGALAAANGNGTAVDDVITVPAGQYVLSSQFPALTVDANQRIAIRGAGANVTSIEPQAGFDVRLLAVGAGAQFGLSDITLRGGNALSGAGGNLSQSAGSTVTLDRLRVTGGQAAQGAGIATSGVGGATTLLIRQTLIDGNAATGNAGTGGGLYIAGATSSVGVIVTDSTIYNNSAVNGGAVAVTFNGTIPPAFRGVTLVGNVARVNPDGPPLVGGVASSSAKVNFQGSIVAANTNPVGLSNCGITNGATDEGGNVTPGNDCGLGGSHADPLLATTLDASQPPALAIGANSPAIDVADCAGRTLDQRGVARPQLSACDAGAYEYQPPPPDPTPQPTPIPTPMPTATPTATPEPNKSVNAERVRGTVLIKVGGKFVPLDEQVVGNGSEIDTRKGRVEITTSTNEKAVFYDGIFKVSQSRGVTTLTLTQKLAPCPKAKRASAAAKKPKTRKLWGDGKGRFKTKGSYSAATVRGTRWLVQDGCRYTRTSVAVGSVSVRDEVLDKTFIVRKGKSYTARPR